MVTILCEADRTTVAEAAKKHKVSEAAIHAWRNHFGPPALLHALNEHTIDVATHGAAKCGR